MRKFDIVLIICFILLIAFGYSVIYNKGSQCVNNSFEYAVKEYSEKFSPVSCSCSFESPKYKSFNINQSGIFPIDYNKFNIYSNFSLPSP